VQAFRGVPVTSRAADASGVVALADLPQPDCRMRAVAGPLAADAIWRELEQLSA